MHKAMAKKKALITGVFGQDGSYLCEILARKGYEVYGITKHILGANSQIIKTYLDKIGIHPTVYAVDLNNFDSLKELIKQIRPDEIYHLAAFHVSAEGANNTKSFMAKQLYDYNVQSTSNLLYICHEYLKESKFVTAGSCLMFDDCDSMIQSESTLFKSASLYGLAKISENMLVKYYRKQGLHASTALLFNHESSRRSNNFVTKKIVKSMVAISKKEMQTFTLGDIKAKKDWGWAKDYAYGMYLMAQTDKAKDYVLASGRNYSISDFIEIVADKLNIDVWQKHINVDDNILTRKMQVNLLGDWSLAKAELNWKHTLSLVQLVDLMVENELTGELA
ncbi:GDP-mannose 4,6-dehydratase [Synechococcus sp. EJ6-Ellesmere]|uniref:GDP-mannose 4,6-dehydratase n=1 Tax=Synechococcus sp. EJ6-Ellesmere TaxID=2823734 RepID=UPI0020CEB557|nr:GDP-mannose 4,6-dehydratase [Synechococcus sp. EJ6-Ellesmere]MCP9824879.1 GDP-mannose 4,6-dehydratase [Synechococcus sp. EJ6-Ellesmere]